MTSQATLQIKVLLGRNIARARAANGVTQRHLAIKLGLDSRAISRWESGKVSPSPANLVALATALGEDPGWFYTNHETGPDASIAA